MDDDLSRPLSYGERRAIEKQREIDKDRGKPFEPERAPVVDADLKKVRRS
jgi:hypothetical protein